MIKILGGYQIVGGIIGAYVLLSVWIPNWNKPNVELLALPFALLFLLLCSIGCLQVLENRKFLAQSIWVSIILQMLQAISFSLKGIEFKFCAGTFIGLLFSNNYEIVFYPFLIDFKFNLVAVGNFVSINLAPFVAIALLYKELVRLPVIEPRA